MNVAYFSNQFADLQGHGLARYSRQLFAALRDLSCTINVTPVAAWSTLDKFDLAKLKHDSGLQLVSLGRRLTPLAWTFLNNPPIEYFLREPVDVVHAVALGYPIATRKPLVVTIHDIGPLTHPEFFGNTSPWIMRRSLRQVVKQADGIICVSQSTADELIDYVGAFLEKRIHVVPEGVSPDFFVPTDPGCLDVIDDLPFAGTPFVMSTGKISPRKNIQGLIKAMSSLSSAIPHHLVLVGGDGWEMDGVYKQLDEAGIRERVHFPGYVTDEQLRALYAAATVYVHPSLYEGFGLTILEAMAANCPVVTSNTWSLPEVAGDAAILVDPSDSDALADAIKSICSNTKLANEFVGKGKVRAGLFQWNECAEKVLDVYRTVV
ncbi:glycosyl transferase, group 1 [hydrothermal vent metagenome]|uniref:Glycosyl transferase, group 1 n=1 Tax=hydrothermal vent metagenome TaxID=652676 RepID=A0A3B1BBT0_9ZZZZ